MAGDWDCADLTGLLTVFAAHVGDLVPTPLQRCAAWPCAGSPAADDQTKGGRAPQHQPPLRPVQRVLRPVSRRDHDVLLGPVRDRRRRAPAAAERLLAQAQRRKVERLLDQARGAPAARLLEIGTGWGELAIRAASAAPSSARHDLRPAARLAARRVAKAGLADRVSVELRDYREVDGEYDAICSVEMIEAVGSATGTRTSPSSTGCSRPAGGSGCSRSRCRTTG